MKRSGAKNVLVGVLKNKRDFDSLLRDRWYRIPLEYAPKRKFAYLAFYQPAIFGKHGKRIEYYAEAAKIELIKRIVLLPNESWHPRANELYLKITVRNIEKLKRPIRNIIPRRVSFGFTDFATLVSARDILALYHVPPTEQIVARCLAHRGIASLREYGISDGAHRYRIDIVIVCKNGMLAIECDNRKAHFSAMQIAKDKNKDKILKKLGWRVIRLKEDEILDHLDRAIVRIEKTIQEQGGQSGQCV